jgi:site-specific DNA-methyltransferase (adenine-specific)
MKRARWGEDQWREALALDRSAVLRCWDSCTALESCPEAAFDAVTTDTPYASGGLYLSSRQCSTRDKYVQTETASRYEDFAGDARDQLSWLRWCRWWLTESLRVTKPGGVLVSFCDWRQLHAMTSAVQEAGWTFGGYVAWDKTEGGARPMEGWFRVGQCEYIIVATHGDRSRTREGVYLPGVVRCPVERGEERVHIAQKPLELCRLLARVVPVGGRVLDLFAGSGSLTVGADLEGCVGLGLERLEANVQKAQERLAWARGQRAAEAAGGAQGVLKLSGAA